MIRRTLLACTAIAVLTAPVAAGAEQLLFSYEAAGNALFPSYAANFSFILSSDPTPQSYTLAAYPYTDPTQFPYLPDYKTNGLVTLSTVDWQGSIPDPGTVTFYSTIPVQELFGFLGGAIADGGLSPILNEYVAGTQIYSGPENAPHFAPGSYGFELGDPAGGQDGGPAFITISPISAVPEPETWATTLVGLGLVGFALRRRATVSVSYA